MFTPLLTFCESSITAGFARHPPPTTAAITTTAAAATAAGLRLAIRTITPSDDPHRIIPDKRRAGPGWEIQVRPLKSRRFQKTD